MNMSTSDVDRAEELFDKLKTLILVGVFHATLLGGKSTRVSMAVAIEMCKQSLSFILLLAALTTNIQGTALECIVFDEKSFTRLGKIAISAAMQGLSESGRRDLMAVFGEFQKFA